MDITTLAQREYERNSKKRRARRNARMEGRVQESNADPQAQQPPPAQQLTDWHDYKAVSHKFDCLDYLIEMHGRIVGMALSPCHRYFSLAFRGMALMFKTPAIRRKTRIAVVKFHFIKISD